MKIKFRYLATSSSSSKAQRCRPYVSEVYNHHHQHEKQELHDSMLLHLVGNAKSEEKKKSTENVRRRRDVWFLWLNHIVSSARRKTRSALRLNGSELYKISVPSLSYCREGLFLFLKDVQKTIGMVINNNMAIHLKNRPCTAKIVCA